MTVRELQKRLKSIGYDPGPVDGLIGPATIRAINLALDRLDGIVTPLPVEPETLVPMSWMPWAQMKGIIWHWTAGTHKANAVDKKPYHIIIEGDGKLIRGDYSIKDNEPPAKADRAHHTLNCNTGYIGTSMAGMKDAKESPFSAGPYPITLVQWQTMSKVLADLCLRYGIPVTESTVLSHAEVEKTLGIKQRNKWDVARLPFDSTLIGAKAIGDEMRKEVKKLL